MAGVSAISAGAATTLALAPAQTLPPAPAAITFEGGYTADIADDSNVKGLQLTLQGQTATDRAEIFGITGTYADAAATMDQFSNVDTSSFSNRATSTNIGVGVNLDFDSITPPTLTSTVANSLGLRFTSAPG